jgi:OOP family OmpA-OmpF porin
MKIRLLFPLIVMFGLPAQAEFVLQLPLGAKETYSRLEPALPPVVAVKPYGETGLETVPAPGYIRRSVWAFGGEQTLAEVQNSILEQLENSDYEILFFCQTEQCGGFDFRFAIDVVPEPEMRVDLRDFRFISARQTVLQEPSYVTFLLSKSPESVYVQMTEYTSVAAQGTLSASVSEPESSVLENTVSGQGDDASMILEGLQFETGSATLGADPENSLKRLADRLSRDKSLKVLLVGHSDMSGTLRANIALSRQRAATIRDILIQKYGIAADRLSAHGVGFLSPRASNETREGRQKNRRVEAVFSE